MDFKGNVREEKSEKIALDEFKMKTESHNIKKYKDSWKLEKSEDIYSKDALLYLTNSFEKILSSKGLYPDTFKKLRSFKITI